jgi:hypothetical protein
MREKFKQMKGQNADQIVQEAQALTEASAAPAESKALVDKERDSQLYYRVIKTRSEVYDIVTRSFSRKKRWSELPHGLDLRNSWNLLWVWSKIKSDITKLLVW